MRPLTDAELNRFGAVVVCQRTGRSAVTELKLAAVAAQAERELRAAGKAERAEHEKAYLKSSLEHAGASLPAIRALGKPSGETILALTRRRSSPWRKSSGTRPCMSSGCWRS